MRLTHEGHDAKGKHRRERLRLDAGDILATEYGGILKGPGRFVRDVPGGLWRHEWPCTIGNAPVGIYGVSIASSCKPLKLEPGAQFNYVNGPWPFDPIRLTVQDCNLPSPEKPTMKRVTTTDFRRTPAEILDTIIVSKQAVEVMHCDPRSEHSKPVAVILPPDEYHALLAFKKRVTDKIAELAEDVRTTK